MVRRFSDAVFIPRLHNADNNSNNKGDNKDVSLEMNHSRDWESLTGKLIPNVFFCFPSSDILATTRKHNTPLDSSYGQFTNPPPPPYFLSTNDHLLLRTSECRLEASGIFHSGCSVTASSTWRPLSLMVFIPEDCQSLSCLIWLHQCLWRAGNEVWGHGRAGRCSDTTQEALKEKIVNVCHSLSWQTRTHTVGIHFVSLD